ncbi:MAG: DUF3789 domain-containing protein [Desulfitobacteriaceae bacterium]|nr:DUF3789 domain-containing protein [Desulfitobacteriaceae bacterium]
MRLMLIFFIGLISGTVVGIAVMCLIIAGRTNGG